jgi:hypothetical protein
MKKAVLLLSLLTPAAVLAQQNSGDATPAATVPTSVNFPIERVQKPTTADLYCSGFVGKPITSRDKYVTGGLESPHTTRFANGEAIYLNGKDYEVGQEYTVLRELRDPNRYELFKGQWAALKAAGQPYDEIARIKVIDTRNKMAIAQIEFGCDAVLPGDFVVPFAEKTTIAFHLPMRFDRFAPSNGQVSGRIILAKDFDSELGTGGKVYLNIGANQGLKAGDFLRAERSPMIVVHDPVDSLSYKSSANEPTQTKQADIDPKFMTRTGGPGVHTSEMPRRGVAELVVLGTTPSTTTAMIVFSMEPVHVGDTVELDQQ